MRLSETRAFEIGTNKKGHQPPLESLAGETYEVFNMTLSILNVKLVLYSWHACIICCAQIIETKIRPSLMDSIMFQVGSYEDIFL